MALAHRDLKTGFPTPKTLGFVPSISCHELRGWLEQVQRGGAVRHLRMSRAADCVNLASKLTIPDHKAAGREIWQVRGVSHSCVYKNQAIHADALHMESRAESIRVASSTLPPDPRFTCNVLGIHAVKCVSAATLGPRQPSRSRNRKTPVSKTS